MRKLLGDNLITRLGRALLGNRKSGAKVKTTTELSPRNNYAATGLGRLSALGMSTSSYFKITYFYAMLKHVTRLTSSRS